MTSIAHMPVSPGLLDCIIMILHYTQSTGSPTGSRCTCRPRHRLHLTAFFQNKFPQNQKGFLDRAHHLHICHAINQSCLWLFHRLQTISTVPPQNPLVGQTGSSPSRTVCFTLHDGSSSLGVFSPPDKEKKEKKREKE